MAKSFERVIREVKKSMQKYPDVSHVVRVFHCEDQFVCKACRKIEGDHYNDDIFTLPNPKDICTNPDGCRCWYSQSTAITYEMPKKKKPSKKQPWWKKL